MAPRSKISRKNSFDKFMVGHVRFWHFGAYLPDNYIMREKIRGVVLKVITAYHFFCNAMYGLPYIYLCIIMILKAEIDIGFISEFPIITSISSRIALLWSRREQFARLLNECRELWSYLRNEDEKAVVKSYEKMVYFYRIFFLVSGFGAILSFAIFAYSVYFQDANGTFYRQNFVRLV